MRHSYAVVHWLLLLGVVLLAAYLRLHRAAVAPGWYSDEGTHLEIVQHLLEGRTQYFALNQSTLLVARLPLFEYLLAAVSQLAGASMQTLRLFTGTLGTLSVVALYVVTRFTLNRRLALLAALLLAIYPQAVLYSRFGFSYNLLAPLTLLIYLGLVKYRATQSRHWLSMAALAVGTGLTSDVIMGTFVVPVLLIIAFTRWHDGLWALPLMALPFTLYALWMLLTVPDAFLFDLSYTLTRLSGKPIIEQMRDLAQNYTVLLSQDFWFMAGMIGLFLLPSTSRTISLLLLLLPIALLGRTVALHNLSAYYMIPLLPLIALGAAQFITRAVTFMQNPLVNTPAKPAAILIALALIATPLASVTYDTVARVNSHYPTAIDPFLLDPDSVQQAADFVNAYTDPGDTVIASPGAGWLIDADTVDFQMAAAFTGQETPHFPANMAASRFAFDPDYEHARYVIVDSLWRNWGAVHIPDVALMLAEVEANWLMVFEAGAIQVYEHPDYTITGTPRSDAPRLDVVASGQ